MLETARGRRNTAGNYFTQMTRDLDELDPALGGLFSSKEISQSQFFFFFFFQIFFYQNCCDDIIVVNVPNA